jgi:competence protein ComGC
MNSERTPPNIPEPKTNKLAITSLVLGILSLVLCVVGIVFAIPGLICGFMGMSRVKKSGGAEKGHGFALAGTVMSGTALVLFPIIGLLTAIAVPNFVKARSAAQKSACVTNLRTIDGAKATWALENKKTQQEIPEPGDLYGPDKYIKQEPTCPAGGTYSLNAVEEKPTCTVPGHAIY